eukprot:scaffold37045_cov62-Phaeocystis_antarctica.AAC.4
MFVRSPVRCVFFYQKSIYLSIYLSRQLSSQKLEQGWVADWSVFSSERCRANFGWTKGLWRPCVERLAAPPGVFSGAPAGTPGAASRST